MLEDEAPVEEASVEDERAALQAAHDAAAEALGVFEAEWIAVCEEWKEKRRAVNDAYKAADSALQTYVVAHADPNRPEPVEIQGT